MVCGSASPEIPIGGISGGDTSASIVVVTEVTRATGADGISGADDIDGADDVKERGAEDDAVLPL